MNLWNREPHTLCCACLLEAGGASWQGKELRRGRKVSTIATSDDKQIKLTSDLGDEGMSWCVNDFQLYIVSQVTSSILLLCRLCCTCTTKSAKSATLYHYTYMYVSVICVL